MRHGVDPPGIDARPIPSAIGDVAETTPFAGGAFPSARTGAGAMLTGYVGRKGRGRPDLLKRELLVRECLADVQERDGPDATEVVNAALAPDQQFFNTDMDSVPELHRFTEEDCKLIRGTGP
jgi:hypothetical protein